MAKEAVLQFSVASVVEDILQQNGTNLRRNIDLVSRKAEEEAFRRYEATSWLRKMVGVVAARDLPEQPSEEEFRFGLRSGLILCNVLNKVQPGSVQRVVESPSVSVASDGGPLSAYQYFENVRNFLDTVQEMGLPTFEASDLEQGGKSGRVVNCVLALKSYSDWKQTGGNSLWKFDGNLKSTSSGKFSVRKNSELFTRSLTTSTSKKEKLDDEQSLNGDLADGPDEMTPQSLNMLLRAALSDKKPEEVPMLVESMLSKVMEEFERRLASHSELMKTSLEDLAVSDGNKPLTETTNSETQAKTTLEDPAVSDGNKSLSETTNDETQLKTSREDLALSDGNTSLLETTNRETQLEEVEQEEENATQIKKYEQFNQNIIDNEESQRHLLKQPLDDEESLRHLLKQQLNDEESQRQLLKQQLDEQESRRQLLKQKLDDEESQRQLLKQQLDEEESQKQLLKQQLDDEESQRQLLKQQLDDEESQRQLLKQQLEDGESQRKLLKQQLDNEESQGRLLKQKLDDEESKRRHLQLQQQQFFDQQQRNIQELRHTLVSTKAGMQFLQTKCLEEYSDLGKHLNCLANAASGYHRVLEENRKLYNQVQDLKGSIRVYCRVRPFLPGESNRSSIVDHIGEGTISILTPPKYGKEGHKNFSFNKVFGPSVTQEEVFEDTQPLIRSVLDGFNVCIFAYGQTGSGKTHTMTGPKELTEQTQGVNFRALNDLFFLSEQRKDTFYYEVSVQMIEIYNEQVRDLLVTDGLNKKLEIRNSSQKGLNVPDANVLPVASTSDVIELMNLGHKNRAVSSTALNDRSSRSHSCLTVHVQGKDLTSGSVLRGCMHLVDLAGSERVNKSEVTGDRLKEAQHINKSLAALGDVISSLAQKNGHVPYRNSKLTQLLQDSLGGQAKTLMFVHISPEPDAVGETLSTLKFAERVATVELGAARLNTGNVDVKDLKEQIASLKAALARKEGEPMQLQRSISYGTERHIPKAGGSSPLYADVVRGDKSAQSGYRQQRVEDVENLEVQKNSTMRPNRSFDLQELLMNSPTRPPVNQKGSEKEFEPRDWVDKVMVNKQEAVNRNGSPLGNWEGDNSKVPEPFYQNVNSKIYPEQQYDVQRSRFEIASTDGSDDLDAATSDSSEPDLHWQQLNLPKVTSLPNGIGSKLRKPTQKLARSPDTGSVHRSSSIPSLIPSPSRKILNGVGPPAQRNGGRQPVSVDTKRKTGK